jgi:predicted RNA-binding Zn ribbon-like protein
MDATDLIAIGDDKALTFLNSIAIQGAMQVELIGDGSSYLTWLRLAGFISDKDEKSIRSRFTTQELDDVAAEARDMREWVRPRIASWAADPQAATTPVVRKQLNSYLSMDSQYLEVDGAGVSQRRRFDELRQLLVPPTVAAAELFAHDHHGLVRPCEADDCSMWFFDRTKAHRRRWCSMALCGNRAKARAHRSRQGAAQNDS